MKSLNWKLKGFNLLHFGCGSDSIIHPETNINQVLLDSENGNNNSLARWLSTSNGNNLNSDLITYLSNYFITSNEGGDVFGFTIPQTLQSLTDADSLLLGSATVNDTVVSGIRVPFGTATMPGTFKVGTGLALSVDGGGNSTGQLNVGAATSEHFGGIKIGYSGAYTPVQLDGSGKAFVNIGSSEVIATLNGWNYDSDSFTYFKTPKIYYNDGDNFESFDLEDCKTRITAEFASIPITKRFYPVRGDSKGKLYTYVPWVDTTYNTFNTSTNGLVPASGDNVNAFLKADGTWAIPANTTYTGLSSINHNTSVNYVVRGSGYTKAPTKFLREDGNWIIPSAEVATEDTLGGIKLGYTDSGDLKGVLIDENQKAYVNISNDNLKNHKVTAINQEVFDEYNHHFDTYTVKCEISNEDLKIVNINDFKQSGTGYIYPQTINTTDEYEWTIGSAGVSNTIGIIHATSTAAKGYFQLIINHGNNIVETHSVGFIIDTPADYAFAWFSTCSWAVSLYGTGDHACRVYLTAPSDFTGTIKITNIHLIVGDNDGSQLGGNVGSMDGSTFTKWSDNTPFTKGSITATTGTLVSTPQTKDGKITVPSGYKVSVDSFVTLDSTPSIGDSIYDSEINDTLIHNLLTRVKSIELWIQNQQ